MTAAASSSLRGRQWYESMGSPKYIVAPMVEGSEYAWRVLSRRYGAELCYSPMIHARIFTENEKQRRQFWSSMKAAKEKKLIVQFCANDPDVLLEAARQVVPYADGVDINFGCPQGIARKGYYGAFLQDDWDTVYALINILHKNLDIPVTAKIRIFPEKEKTLEYAKMILRAGANILTVHCRTRDQKGQATGLGDWSILRYLRDNLPSDTVLFANGNILYHEDIHKCLETTGFDGMMVAETNLHNPGIFMPNCYPRVDQIMKEYLTILEDLNDDSSRHPVKGHMFKLIKPAILKFMDLRNELGVCGGNVPWSKFYEVHKKLEERVLAEIDASGDTDDYEYTTNEDGYKVIPWYRSQPSYRKKILPNPDHQSNAQESTKQETPKTTADRKNLKRCIDQVEAAESQPPAIKQSIRST